MPAHIRLAIGLSSFDKWQLIEHVKNEDKTGIFIVNEMMEYLRSFKRKIYETAK